MTSVRKKLRGGGKVGNECQKDVFGNCCCECAHHLELMSSPLFDGQSSDHRIFFICAVATKEGKAFLSSPHGCCELHTPGHVKRWRVEYRCNSSGNRGETVCQSPTFRGALDLAEHLMGDIAVIKIEEA